LNEDAARVDDERRDAMSPTSGTWDAYKESQKMVYRVLENGHVIVETIMNLQDVEKAIEFMSVGHHTKAWRDEEGWFIVDCGIKNQVVQYRSLS
jgi:hypothetical protein